MSEYTTYIFNADGTALEAVTKQVPDEPPKPVDPEPLYKGADYLVGLTSAEKRAEIVNDAVRKLSGAEFDSIAFIGLSGALLAPTLAYVMKKELIALRKSDENSHSFHTIEGFAKSQRYIVVDDFMCSGATVRGVIQRMEKFAPQAKLVGLYMYSDEHFYSSANGDMGRYILGE